MNCDNKPKSPSNEKQTGLTIDFYELTVGGRGFQVSIQKRKDPRVARPHYLQGNVGGPVLKGIKGNVCQGNVAQTQLQRRLDVP